MQGDLLAGGGIESERTVRVWLESEAAYDQAIAAHRARLRVHARGGLSGTGGRAELIVSDNNFAILGRDA
jgi:hypothetical protein